MNLFNDPAGIITEIGEYHFPYELAYHTYGQKNKDGSNVKWVFHALTANSHAQDWWSGLFGEGKILDPSRDFIICANMPGSCYGSTGPLSTKPGVDEKYYYDFPTLTIRDIVKMFRKLKEALQIDTIHMGIGGSMGGSVLLEWLCMFPDDFRNAVLVATSAKESSWGKAIHTVHKMAIETDPTWNLKRDDAGMEGLKTARGVGMLFYRTYNTFNLFQIDDNDTLINYKSDSYIRYQGTKLVNRFNAHSYYCLLNTLDTHNVGRKRGSVENALHQIKSRCLIIGINSDILYPKEEQQFLSDHIKNNKLIFMDSDYGHDGFLIETEQINQHATAFLEKN